MPRTTQTIPLNPFSVGQTSHLLIHTYRPKPSSITQTYPKIYIQAGLHADELPGLLVLHHLLNILEVLDKHDRINGEIVIIPYANPIGLSQVILGSHLGRFNIQTGTNFNRNFLDVTTKVAERISNQLSKTDATSNIQLIRKAILEEVEQEEAITVEKNLKKVLFSNAATADVVLDLHCDSEAILHMYTHDRLWPAMSDLAEELTSQCTLIASKSGGEPFDESFSCPWAELADQFPDYPIPMACQSVTIELRGETQVEDGLAVMDAHALIRFLHRRGFLSHLTDLEGIQLMMDRSTIEGKIQTIQDSAFPLSGVDMIEAPKYGVLAWRVHAGDWVEVGQLLGEIVDIEDFLAPRCPIIARNTGLVFGMRLNRLAIPGETVIKVAGKNPLDWRKGNLLTSR